MSKTAILGCVPWGHQQIPSVEMECEICECSIAVSRTNIAAAQDMLLLCVRCLYTLKPISEIAEAKALWKGLDMSIPEAIRLASAERDRN
jgi:hypothetical protein